MQKYFFFFFFFATKESFDTDTNKQQLKATDVGQVVLSGVSVSGTVTPTTVTGNFTGLFITGSSFTGNTNKNHSLNGGAIMATVASLTVSASSFVNNSARAGHGIFAVASGN